MSQPSGCVEMVPNCRSHTAARKLGSVSRLPDPETISTLPLFSNARCTGLIGIVYGKVAHVPCVPACARRGGPGDGANPTAHPRTATGADARVTLRTGMFVRISDSVFDARLSKNPGTA